MDTELRWQDIPDEKLERLADTLAFLDAKGLRFYLPRFMLYALEHEGRPDDTGVSRSAQDFSDPRDTTGRHRMFSAEQMNVLRAFTDYFFPPPDRDD